MKNPHSILLYSCCLLITLCLSQIRAESITGNWQTIDDETGEPRSVVEIYERDGKIYGDIIKIYPREDEDPDPICDKCSGYRKDQKIVGMTIIDGLGRDGDKWSGSKILDPEKGKSYNCKLWLEDGKLRVRGSVFVFHRTQTWLRMPEVNEGNAGLIGRRPEQSNSLADFIVFQDDAENYLIRYPHDWSLEDSTSGGHMIRADITKDQSTGLQIRIHRAVSSDVHRYVASHVEQFLEDMKAHWKGSIHETGRHYGEIGTNSGCRVTMVFERSDGTNWFFKQYLWPRGDEVVLLQCGTPLESQLENEPILDRISATFEFVD